MTAALVSVVLPCYNAADYVSDALASILNQTHKEIEVLAIDDGSTDATLQRLGGLASLDPRVRLLTNPSNLGLIATLNRGLEEARGAYIARMDADDRSHPRRIEKQVLALEGRVDVGVVGTPALVMDGQGRQVRQLPVRCVEPSAATFLSLFATPILHPTMLARAEVMSRFRYSSTPSSLHTEDYELFARMIRSGVGFLNLVEPLYDYRVWPGRVSERFEREQVENFVVTARAHLMEMLGIEIDPGVHRFLINRIDRGAPPRDLGDALKLLAQLCLRFSLGGGPNEAGREEVVRIADEQRLDIVAQTLLRGTVAQRFAAMAMGVRYLRRLSSAHSMRYFREKLSR